MLQWLRALIPFKVQFLERHGNSQPSVTLIPPELELEFHYLLASISTKHTHGTQIYMQEKHSYTQNKINKIKLT